MGPGAFGIHEHVLKWVKRWALLIACGYSCRVSNIVVTIGRGPLEVLDEQAMLKESCLESIRINCLILKAWGLCQKRTLAEAADRLPALLLREHYLVQTGKISEKHLKNRMFGLCRHGVVCGCLPELP